MPGEFDAPLAAHHRIIGQWVAGRTDPARSFTRPEARRHIERTFLDAVLGLLAPIGLTNLRVNVLMGDAALPPALAIFCDDIGQLDCKWIEKTSVLAHTALGEVAPVGWRAAAYHELCTSLVTVLAMFNYEDLIEELSVYYWDGATTDNEARDHMVNFLGVDPDDELILPSDVAAKRPDFMTVRPAPLADMPRALADRIRRLRAAHAAHREARTAWQFEHERVAEYIPEFNDVSTLPPLTLVPFDHFAREMDEVGRSGMELGFMTITGLVELPGAAGIEDWFTSFRLGLDVLRAAQDLIDFDPTAPEARR